MLKKKKTKPSNRCPVVASGGALGCALELGHNGPHSTTNSAPRKVMQHATWTTLPDGRVAVTTYSRGKKQSGWMEEAPLPTPRPMTLEDEPDDPEAEESGLAAIEAEERQASLSDACKKCGRELGEHDGKKCPKPKDSNIVELEDGTLYDRRSPIGPPVKFPESWTKKTKTAKKSSPRPERPCGATMAGIACTLPKGHNGDHAGKGGEWSRDRVSGRFDCAPEHDEREDDDVKVVAIGFVEPSAVAAPPDVTIRRIRFEFDEPGDDPYEDEVRSDTDRDLARQHREARETHARDLEDEEALTKIGNHSVHPAAALFPLIEGAEYQAFLDDIRTNGQRKKIVRIGDLILDGRNRLRACIDLGIEPRFRSFGSDLGDGTDPIAFVISENIARRHLDETQRAFVGVELVPMYEAQARDRMLAGKNPSPNSGEGGKATERAARAVNVGKSSIEAALKVKRDAAPEVLAAARERGQIKVSTAAELAKLPQAKQREIMEKVGGGALRSGKVRAYVNQEKKRDVVRKINERRVVPMPGGLFGVIYGDYPWHYDNSDQHEGSRGHLGYPTMKMEGVIAHALEAAKRAAGDCIVALWSTNLYITRMERVVEAYGAEIRTVFTWPKPKFGVGTWGRGQTEHLVIASIGSPVHTLNEVSTLLPSWKPAHPDEHSSKPAEVAELLAKHCGGPFLELFSREEREGWASWGAETGKFATEAA